MGEETAAISRFASTSVQPAGFKYRFENWDHDGAHVDNPVSIIFVSAKSNLVDRVYDQVATVGLTDGGSKSFALDGPAPRLRLSGGMPLLMGPLRLRLGSDCRVALMCSEAVWWRCHRRIITDHLLLAGHAVDHLMAPGHSEHATPTLAGVRSVWSAGVVAGRTRPRELSPQTVGQPV